MSSADDARLFGQVQQLDGVLGQLKGQQGSFSELNFQQYKSAGTHQWSGNIKSTQFDENYESAFNQVKTAESALEEAISTCQSTMYNLAWAIDDPIMKAQALWIATF